MQIYSNFTNTVTVYVGTKHGDKKFFLIDKYDGSSDIPNYGNTCADRVSGSSEGVAYPQFITKNTTIKYWRKTFCKMAVLRFKSKYQPDEKNDSVKTSRKRIQIRPECVSV